MLTVASLARRLRPQVVAGRGNADRAIRWVHITELEDPTPWLSGGELLLTTGSSWTTAAKQKGFVGALAEREVAGLGIGTGFAHDKPPAALLEEADKLGMPVFEVPYEKPFIAITERAFARLVNEQYDVLERATQVHESLESLVIEGRGLAGVLAAVSEAVSGPALVIETSGRELAQHPEAGVDDETREAFLAELLQRSGPNAMTPFSPKSAPLADRSVAVPVSGRGGVVAWLVVIGTPRPSATSSA